MGLATARALAQAGRDVVVCEQFELGHARGSSHGSSRIVRLSYPDERWVRFAQETLPALARARGGERPALARAARHARPRRLGAEPRCTRSVRGAVRGARRRPDRAAVRHPRRRRRERLVPGGRRDRPCGRSRRGVRRRPRGARARPRRDGRRGRRRRHRGRRARAGGRRHRGRVGAGARGRRCDPHGGDRHLLRPRPADAVCHRHDDGRPPRLRARVAGRLTEGRSPSDRDARPTPTSPASPTESSPPAPPPGSSAGFPALGRRGRRRRASTRSARTTNSCSSGAAGSSSARRAAATASSSRRVVGQRLAALALEALLAEEVALLGDREVGSGARARAGRRRGSRRPGSRRPCPSRARPRPPARPRPRSGSHAARSPTLSRTPRRSSIGVRPATPSATSVVPWRNGRPNESLTITPTSRPARSRIASRIRAAEASGSSGSRTASPPPSRSRRRRRPTRRRSRASSRR